MFQTGIIDPRPAQERARLNRLAIRDLKDCARWGLHLSELEHDSLVRLHPDTLGHDDKALSDGYWKLFISDPASKPYRIQAKI
jgi:hypothetical protein